MERIIEIRHVSLEVKADFDPDVTAIARSLDMKLANLIKKVEQMAEKALTRGA